MNDNTKKTIIKLIVEFFFFMLFVTLFCLSTTNVKLPVSMSSVLLLYTLFKLIHNGDIYLIFFFAACLYALLLMYRIYFIVEKLFSKTKLDEKMNLTDEQTK